MKMNKEHESCHVRTKNHLYKIGMFAQMNHITIKTLRFYEEQGVLLPAHVDEKNGYRYYTMDQMAIVQQIIAMKRAGFTLCDIKQINAGTDEKILLQKKKIQILEQIAELTKQMTIIDSYLLDKNSSFDSPVLIKTIPGCKVAAYKKIINSYDELFDIMPEMGAEMETLGCECSLPEYNFIQYLEPGLKDKDILIEMCEAVTKLQEGTETLKFYEFPDITAACIFHKGSYVDFPKTYAVVLKYIEENEYDICGNIRESYIDGIWNKDTEEEWLTEIQIPVKKK